MTSSSTWSGSTPALGPSIQRLYDDIDLDKRLQAADEKIDNFNVEETHFGWETTVYPLKLELTKQLTPYLRLYEITVEFNEKYKWESKARV